MAKKESRPRFVVCVSSDGCDDLEVWKLYRVLPDAKAEAEEYLRVVDESGEDYLYPTSRFVPVELTAAAVRQVLSATSSVA